MRKLSFFLTLFLAFSLVLASCAPETDNGEGGDLIATPAPQETEVVETPGAQETPTVTAGTPALETPTQVPAVTSDPDSLPGTGALNPALVSNLLEFDVCAAASTNEDAWGQVEDLIIDFRSEYRLTPEGPNFDPGSGTALAFSNGRIAYILLAASDDLGLPARVLLPWKAISLGGEQGDDSRADGCLFVQVDPELVQRAPIINLDTIDITSAGWDAEIRAFWETELGDLTMVGGREAAPGGSDTPAASTPGPSATPGAGTPGTIIPGTPEATPVSGGETAQQTTIHLGVFRASDLIGLQIEGVGGEALGEVSDLVVDAPTGAVLYVVAEVGGLAGIGGRQIIAPAWLFLQRRDGQSLFLPSNSASLANAPLFGPDEIMNAVDQEWDIELFRWWMDIFRPQTSP